MKRLSPISLLFLVCKLVATTSARLNTVWIGERVAFSRPGGGVVEENKWDDERERGEKRWISVTKQRDLDKLILRGYNLIIRL